MADSVFITSNKYTLLKLTLALFWLDKLLIFCSLRITIFHVKWKALIGGNVSLYSFFIPSETEN